MEYKIGDTAKCVHCGESIVFTHTYWEHIGHTPRHPAQPSLDVMVFDDILTINSKGEIGLKEGITLSDAAKSMLRVYGIMLNTELSGLRQMVKTQQQEINDLESERNVFQTNYAEACKMLASNVREIQDIRNAQVKLHDSISDAMREFAETISTESASITSSEHIEQDNLVKLTISVEKELCKALGREWTPLGVTVGSLLEEIAKRVNHE